MQTAQKPRIRVRTDGTIVPSAAADAFGIGSYFGSPNTKRDAARHDLAEFSGWRPNLRFAGTTYGRDWETVTGRARDLDENNGWINGGIDRRVEFVIGVNIRLSAQPVHDLLNRDYQWRMDWTGLVQSRFRVWGNDIEHRNDTRRRLTFGAQAKLAYLTYARDGEVAAEIRQTERGLANTTNVLLVESERISHPQDLGLIEGPTLRNGVHMDADGAPIGYYVRKCHPNDPNPTFEAQRWDYIPARGSTGMAKFLHVFSPRRIEQNRGISRLAEVMVPAKMLDRVDRAEVEAALKAALFSIFIKSPGTTEDLQGALAPASDDTSIDPWIDAYLSMRNEDPIIVNGAQVTHLLPDESVETPDNPHPNANYASFAKFIIQKIAGSLGVATPQISGDWSAINYSSARAMLNEIWRSFLEDRHFFCQHFLTPIYAAWLEVEVANGDVKIPGGPSNFYRNKTAICMAEWIGPGRGSVDPLKEGNADNLNTAAGRTSTPACILESGRDPSDVMAEEAWYIAEREARGLPPVNHNVKADTGAAESDGSADGTGATEQDRDGDGIPLEGQKKKSGTGGNR